MNPEQGNISEINKITEDKNNEFKNAHAPRQRVMIAEDALKQLLNGKYIPESGMFVRFNKTEEIKIGEELQKMLPNIKECNVCACGALFFVSNFI